MFSDTVHHHHHFLSLLPLLQRSLCRLRRRRQPPASGAINRWFFPSTLLEVSRFYFLSNQDSGSLGFFIHSVEQMNCKRGWAWMNQLLIRNCSSQFLFVRNRHTSTLHRSCRRALSQLLLANQGQTGTRKGGREERASIHNIARLGLTKPVDSNFDCKSSFPIHVPLLPRLSALRAAWLVSQQKLELTSLGMTMLWIGRTGQPIYPGWFIWLSLVKIEAFD